jgi:DNA-binding transcriptional LysR family regulator
MRLHQLKCFTTLYQTLHYTEAANQLFVSQPSLSYAIRELEKELGVKLFEKHGKTISATKYATAFLPFAQTAIDSLHAGELKLKDMMNPLNLRLGYIFSLSYDFLPSIFSLLPHLAANEDFTFSFYQGMSEDLVQNIQEDKLDLAFTPYYQGEGISSFPVFSQEIFLVVPKSHPLADEGEVAFSTIANEKFALIKSGTHLRHVIDDIFTEYEVDPNVVFEAEECNSIASYVASDFGISLIPRIPPLVQYNLSFLRIKDFPINRTIYLIWKTDSVIKPIIKQIQDSLKEHFDPQQINIH